MSLSVCRFKVLEAETPHNYHTGGREHVIRVQHQLQRGDAATLAAVSSEETEAHKFITELPVSLNYSRDHLWLKKRLCHQLTV